MGFALFGGGRNGRRTTIENGEPPYSREHISSSRSVSPESPTAAGGNTLNAGDRYTIEQAQKERAALDTSTEEMNRKEYNRQVVANKEKVDSAEWQDALIGSGVSTVMNFISLLVTAVGGAFFDFEIPASISFLIAGVALGIDIYCLRKTIIAENGGFDVKEIRPYFQKGGYIMSFYWFIDFLAFGITTYNFAKSLL